MDCEVTFFRLGAGPFDWQQVPAQDLRPGDVCLALKVVAGRVELLLVLRVRQGLYARPDGCLAIDGFELDYPLFVEPWPQTGPKVGLRIAEAVRPAVVGA
jgi:hypothetical protein